MSRLCAKKMHTLTAISYLLLIITVSADIYQVGLASADSNRPAETIERPVNRAHGGFVPRLGRRSSKEVDDQRLDSLGRLVCAHSPDCNQLVLLGALVKRLAIQESQLNEAIDDSMAQPPVYTYALDRTAEDNSELLRSLEQDQIPRRAAEE